jgi:hypothetical protein
MSSNASVLTGPSTDAARDTIERLFRSSIGTMIEAYKTATQDKGQAADEPSSFGAHVVNALSLKRAASGVARLVAATWAKALEIDIAKKNLDTALHGASPAPLSLMSALPGNEYKHRGVSVEAITEGEGTADPFTDISFAFDFEEVSHQVSTCSVCLVKGRHSRTCATVRRADDLGPVQFTATLRARGHRKSGTDLFLGWTFEPIVCCLVSAEQSGTDSED